MHPPFARLAAAALLAILPLAQPAHAQPQAGALDRIHAANTLRCAAVARTGIAEPRDEGGVAGVAVDLCRAVATALLGPSGRVLFTLYEAPTSFDAIRTGQDDLAFLTGSEIANHALAPAILPGPTAAILESAVLVPAASPVTSLAGLSNRIVCLRTGSAAHRALEDVVAARHIPIGRLPFQEQVEMIDAYNARRCDAVAGAAPDLAAMQQAPGIRGTTSRLLPEPLDADPLIAVTPMQDGPLMARVAWVFAALLLSDAPESPWHAAPAADRPGLRPHWHAEVRAAVGTYAAIIDRNLTHPLHLPAGPNALWPAGLLLPAAIR